MIIDPIVRALDVSLQHVLDALNGKLDARNNFAPQGTAGQVLVSKGADAPPDFGPFVTSDDIEITNPLKGLILKSPNGTRWRVTIDNAGNLVRTAI